MDDHAPRLLVVEDEPHLAAGLKLNFELDGFVVDVAGTTRDAAALLAQPTPYQAILLDVMLPDIDGYTFCRRLRDAGNFTPVLMLTARGSVDARIQGLEAGADDYVVKPFEVNELKARVQSMLRRRRWDDEPGAASATAPKIRFGRAVIDLDTHEIRVDGVLKPMTQLELELVTYFARHPGRVISRVELLEQVWKLRNYGVTRTVDNFVMRLRKTFEVDPSRPRHFVSVRGAGYRFQPDPGEAGPT